MFIDQLTIYGFKAPEERNVYRGLIALLQSLEWSQSV